MSVADQIVDLLNEEYPDADAELDRLWAEGLERDRQRMAAKPKPPKPMPAPKKRGC